MPNILDLSLRPPGVLGMKRLPLQIYGLMAIGLLQSAIASKQPNADLTDLPLENLLNTEVYSASKFVQKKTEAPAAVTVITAQDIKDYGYGTLGAILESVRGIYTSYDRIYTYTGIRGYNNPGDFNTRILILLDGNRLNDNVYDQAPVGTEFPVDVDMIERVEFVPGSGSAIYGNNAFFGVVNVITKTGKDYRGKGVESANRVASYNTNQSRLTYGKRFDSGADLVLSGTHYDSGGQSLFYPVYATPQTNYGWTHHTDYDQANRLFGKLSWHNITFEAGISNRGKGVPDAIYNTVFNNPDTEFVDQLAFFDLRYADEIADNLQLTGHVFNNYYDFAGHYTYDHPLPITHSLEKSRGYWWGTEIRLISTHFDDHKIVLGTEVQDNFRQDINYYPIQPINYSTGVNTSTYRYAFYLQDEYTIFNSLILNAGVRYDEFSNVGGTINPRVALIYEPWDNTAFKLLYGRAFRAPNINELYNTGATYKPNPSLRPETINSYESIIEYQPLNNLKLTATGFHYKTHDFIQQVTDPIDDMQIYVNAGSNEAWGAEFELEHHWENGMRLRTSYAWVNATNEYNGKIMVNSPVSLAKLNFVAPLFDGLFRLGLDGQYTSSRKTGRGFSTTGFPLLNVTLSSSEQLTRSILPGLEISASVYNLFDEDYASVAGDQFKMSTIPQNKRNFRMVFTLHY